MNDDVPRLKNINEMNFIRPPDDIPPEILQQNKASAEQLAREDELAILDGIRGILGHSSYIAKTSVGKNSVEDQIELQNLKESIQKDMGQKKDTRIPQTQPQPQQRQQRPIPQAEAQQNTQPVFKNTPTRPVPNSNVVYDGVSNDNIIKLIKRLGNIEQKLDILVNKSENKIRKTHKVKPKAELDK